MKDLFKAGIVVISGCIILLGMVFFIGRIKERFKSKYTITIYYTHVDGIRPGAPARISGVNAGIVTDVILTENFVNVNVDIDSAVKIRENAEFYIGTSGLMGEKFIEIVNGTDSLGFIQPGAKIRGKDPLLLSKLFNESRDMIVALRNTVLALNSLLDKNNKGSFVNNVQSSSENLNNILTDVKKITEELSSNTGGIILELKGTVTEIRDVISENRKKFENTLQSLETLAKKIEGVITEKNKKEFDAILEHVSETTGRLNRILKEFDEKEGGVKDIKATIADFKSSAQNLKKITGEIDEVVSDGQIREKIEKTLASVNKISDSIGNVFGKKFNFFYKLRFLSSTDDYHSDVLVELPLSEKEQMWAGVDDIGGDNEFNLQMHTWKRNFAKKIGIFSSKVGVGIDYRFRKRFLYSIDLIDTVAPYINLAGKYGINENFWLELQLTDVFDEKDFNISLRQKF